MKKNANQLHDELTKKLITENYVDLKPINKIEATPKADFEKKFFDYINEAGEKSLNPIVNRGDKNDLAIKYNTKEQEEKIKSDDKLKFEMDTKEAGSFKVSNEVENIASHNYDYSPKVDNINNVNAQEMLTGVYCEIKNDPNLTLEEAQAKAIANLAKDSLHYVKEGQFGVEGLGYQEQKVQENDGETYGGSGYSEKLKDGGESWSVVKEGIKNILKENFAGIAISGNPNSFASMSCKVINDMLAEEGLKEIPNSLDNFVNELNDEKDLPMDENAVDKAINSSQEKAGMDEEARPDYPDIDGDGDTKEPMAKAAKDKEKKKKVKKESIDSKLAEIGKEAEAVKLEAQLDFLHDHIQEKVDRVNSINEDDNLKELIDKSKMKQMQKEIKLLEKRKGKMEKMYEKMCGKSYKKPEMVDEMDEVSWNEKNNPTRGASKRELDPKKVGQSTSAYAINENE